MTTRADPFTAMAAKIDLNAEHGFGGAFVVMPPGEEAVPMTLLMLDDGANEAMFWANVQTMAAMALQAIQARESAAARGFR